MVRAQNFAVAAAVLALMPSRSLARNPLADSTDVQISAAREWESSVFVSPRDPNVILVGNNLRPVGGSGVVFWTSVDGGKTWATNFTVPFVGTDPAAAISGNTVFPQGRLLANWFQTTPGDLLLRYKDNPAAAWSADITVSPPELDKPHLWVDNSLHSVTRRYHVYCAWTHIVKPPEPGIDAIRVKRSVNDGAVWSPAQELDFGQAARGVHIQTGRTGRVYVIWPRKFGVGFGFSESNEDVPGFQLNAPDSLLIGASYHFPVMAVDKSDSTRDHLYVVWADAYFTPTNIRIMKGSALFSAGSPTPPVVWDIANIGTVNPGTGQGQLPWVTWDDCTGMLAVVWLDLRDPPPAGRRSTYVAVAQTRDANGNFLNANNLTWTEFKVSDSHWKTDIHPGQGTYDYIGIAASDGRAFPVWSDDRTDEFRPYTSWFLLWGVTQSSIVHTVVSIPGLQLSVSVTWNTSMSATGTDYLVLTAPSGQTYTVTGTGGGTSHTLSHICPCEPGWWKYVVKSTRPGFTTRGSDERKFFANCLD